MRTRRSDADPRASSERLRCARWWCSAWHRCRQRASRSPSRRRGSRSAARWRSMSRPALVRSSTSTTAGQACRSSRRCTATRQPDVSGSHRATSSWARVARRRLHARRRRSVPASGRSRGAAVAVASAAQAVDARPSMAPARSARSTLPLPCTIPVDAVTTVAGPYHDHDPVGRRSGREDRSQTPLRRPCSGTHPPRRHHPQPGRDRPRDAEPRRRPNGGFLFAGAIFAYGVVDRGNPKLWTPVFNQRSTGGVEKAFVGCTAAPLGTVTLTEHLVPETTPDGVVVDGQFEGGGCRRRGHDRTGPAEQRSACRQRARLGGDQPQRLHRPISCLEDTNPPTPLTSSGASLGQIPVSPATTGDAT